MVQHEGVLQGNFYMRDLVKRSTQVGRREKEERELRVFVCVYTRFCVLAHEDDATASTALKTHGLSKPRAQTRQKATQIVR